MRKRFIPSYLDYSRTCRSTWGPMCRDIWRAAIAMAQRLEVYRGGDGAKAGGKGPKKYKNQKKGMSAQVKGSSSRGTVQVVQVVRKPQQKKGKGGSGSVGKKTKRGGRKKVQYHNCGGGHFLRDCKEWKEIKEKLRSSSGKD